MTVDRSNSCMTMASRPATVTDMLTWFVRMALLRFVGRRVVPLLILFDLLRMLVAARRTWMKPKSRP
jgi:hypothetical protein